MKKPTLYPETLPDLSKQAAMQKLQATAREIKPIANILNLWLPYPSSVNENYATVIKYTKARKPYPLRIDSEAYKNWQTIAGLALNAQAKMLFDCDILIHYKVKLPTGKVKRRRDLDNLLKPMNDILVAHKIIKDDDLIQKLIVEWVTEGKDGVEVKIEKFEQLIKA